MTDYEKEIKEHKDNRRIGFGVWVLSVVLFVSISKIIYYILFA